jgi:hypothetical protein
MGMAKMLWWKLEAVCDCFICQNRVSKENLTIHGKGRGRKITFTIDSVHGSTHIELNKKEARAMAAQLLLNLEMDKKGKGDVAGKA